MDLETIRGRYFVCTRHFRDSDYKNKLSRSLNVTANPSLNLFALNDDEGLNRVIPPMTRPVYSELQKHTGSSGESVTVSLEVQPLLPENRLQNVDMKFLADSSTVSPSLEIMDMTSLVADDPLVAEPPPKHENLYEKISQKRTMAGYTPRKIFKFKRKSDVVVDFDNMRESAKKSVLLRTVKFVSPKKEKVNEARIAKVMTISTETQTESETCQLESRSVTEESAVLQGNEEAKILRKYWHC